MSTRWRSSCFATKWRSCAARPRGRDSRQPIASSWAPPVGCCHARSGRCSSSNRPRCSSGIVGRSPGALDLSSPCRPKADPPRDSAADPADRARESAMRLSAHRRRTERNRCRRIGDHRPERAPRGTSGSGWWPIGAIVASIPAVASEEPHRRRFLHRRHGLAATVVRLVLSKWPRGACTSPAAAPIPTARGSRSRHVRSRGRSPNARSRFAC